MRKWYALIVILAVGILTVMLLLFFVARSPERGTDADTAPRGFTSFFGRQFGLFNDDPSATSTNDAKTDARPTFRQRLSLERMIPVSAALLSGITFTATSTATSTVESARYVLRETGRVEDFSLETGEARRVTNTTVPRVQEAFFGVNGSAVALRYLANDNETVETYVAPLPTDPLAPATELVGTFFRQNIPSLAFSPDTDEVFYLSVTGTGATGRISNLSGTASRVVFFSPLREWLAAWADGALVLTTKPSYRADGTALRVTESGGESRLVSGVFGLTTLPNPGMTRILYSESTGSATKLFMYDTSTRQVTPFLIPTLPEKCVWADDRRAVCAVPNNMSGTLPDAWYDGSVSFSDSFWMLDGETGRVDFMFDPTETPARENVDAVSLTLSHDNSVLGFINKKDLRGWVADLSEWFRPESDFY